MKPDQIPLKRTDPTSHRLCARKYDYYLADIRRGKIKACCKTQYYPHTQSIAEDLDEILKDRAALKRGEKIQGCENCWQLENEGHSSFRSEVPYSHRQNMQDSVHQPFAFEFWLDNLCNLKCVYCDPVASSKWAAEKSDATARPPDSNGSIPGEIRDFVEKIWPTVDRFNITGGEPSLMSGTFKVIDLLREISTRRPPPVKKMLNIVSNFATPTKVFDAFLNRIQPATEQLDIDFGVSAESMGAEFEFIRDGASFETFQANFENMLQRKCFMVTLMSAHSVLSLKNYPQFLAYVCERQRHHGQKINFVYNEVVSPHVLSPRRYPSDLTSQRQALRDLLQRQPPELIPYRNFFELFRQELDGLYASAGAQAASAGFAEFMDQAAPRRIQKMDWRRVFPDLA